MFTLKTSHHYLFSIFHYSFDFWCSIILIISRSSCHLCFSRRLDVWRSILFSERERRCYSFLDKSFTWTTTEKQSDPQDSRSRGYVNTLTNNPYIMNRRRFKPLYRKTFSFYFHWTSNGRLFIFFSSPKSKTLLDLSTERKVTILSTWFSL